MSNRIKKIAKNREFSAVIGLVILCVLFSVLNHAFYSVTNILNVLRSVSILGMVAMGMTLVIICGGVDLSVGATYGMASMFAAYMMTHGISIWISVLTGIIAGFIVGTINGNLVTRFDMPPLIATLGMMNIARGLALIITGGLLISVTNMSVSDKTFDTFKFMGTGKIFGQIPILVLFFVITILITSVVLRRSIVGFRMKAIGGNIKAADAAGISSKSYIIGSYAYAGVLAALAGILNMAFLGTVQGTSGDGTQLNAIAAVVIGGTSIKGGAGSVFGTVIGVLIMGVLKNGLVLVGMSTYTQDVMVGVVIIGSVALDYLKRRNQV